MNKLKIGIVGLGFITDWHIKGISENPSAQLVGLCTPLHPDSNRNASLVQHLKDKCRELNVRAYETFQSMIEDPDVDALIIASINPLHYEHIKAAINHGKHVMVEKPVVTNFDQLREIESLSAQMGVKIFPAHNFVYRPAVQKAKELIEKGALGQIIHSSFVVTHTISKEHSQGWRANRELSFGGALMDSGHHLIYQALYLLGLPSKVQAFTSKMALKNMDCEDTAQVSLLYPDGSMAVILQSWASNHGEMINGIRIFGTDGSIVISDGLYHNGEKIDSEVNYLDSFVHQALAFTDFIYNDTPPLSGLSDVSNALQITFSAYNSADYGVVID